MRILAGLKGWKLYILLYIGLLLISHLVSRQVSSPFEKDAYPENKMTLQVVSEKGRLTNKKIDIAYEDLTDSVSAQNSVVVLLPGGPEGPDVFNRLAPELKKEHRIIIPYLPGYGTSKKELPNYSFQALAKYSEQLIKQLNISKVHVIGYGLGGASAIYWAHSDSSRVQSLTLLSSIGVQELELLGGYRLNHAVHGLQLAAIWLLHNAIPHFGLFDALGVSVPYARSYYESDQRPIRSHLKTYRKPMLILHGIEDPLVPVAVAREHYRIVPQSKMEIYSADHDLAETHSDSLANRISSFISMVEEGRARTASQASDNRIKRAQKPFSNVDFAKFKGVSLLILMLIIIFSTLISEDLTCIGAGLLAARGLIGFWPATLACLIGIFLGDIGLYLAGRFIGRKAVKKAPFKWFISSGDLDKSAEWFKRKGPIIIIASRFLPGSRLPTYFSAGVIGAGFWMFSFYFLLAAIVWTPILVGISKILGNELLRYFSLYQNYAIWAFLGLVILLIVIAKAIIPAFSYRGRRFLVSRYRRLTCWQYWPSFILYLPVTCYVLYLGLKYRCMTLFALSNPGIPDGGFAGESKSAILEKFDDQYVGIFSLLPIDMGSSKNIEKACAFMEDHNLNFPIVLKPDVGQRGKGVEIIRTKPMLKRYIQKANRDLIIQEFIEGQEYGLFYYRLPEENQGRLLSITIKNLLCVEGDGERTIEELILANGQAVTLAKFHLRKNQDQLYNVPQPGETVPIVELGTHVRGAIFEEGSFLKTPKLVDQLNNICNPAGGFFFGRLDVKTLSDEGLKNGEGIKIIEVNGVTSESTNIYDRKYSFINGVEILCKQWGLAFEIGEQNRSNGINPPGSYSLLKRTFRTLFKNNKG